VAIDPVFNGSIPEVYDALLVPLIFEPYAEDLARRIAALAPARLLETAAGTGVVTRALARTLPPEAEIIATDLSQAMLDRAAAISTERPVRWLQADAMALPFEDASVDVVACQFGVMFFPDKVKAYSEARRVLRPGGTFVFAVWDGVADNDFARVVHETLGTLFPTDPPGFIDLVPYGYHDRDVISAELAAAGFAATPSFETVTERSVASSALEAAAALCQGTPARTEIESRGADLTAVTAACAAAIADQFGSTGAVVGKIQAKVVVIQA